MDKMKNFLIRNMPIELSEKQNKQHCNLSREAILSLSQFPEPFDWGSIITTQEIQDAIDEGRL